MKKWIMEDWAFCVETIEGKAEQCRLGIETGDEFRFEYGCPENFCPRAMIEVYTWCEVIRCGGDFISRGSQEKYAMDFSCPCHCLRFRLTAIPIHR